MNSLNFDLKDLKTKIIPAVDFAKKYLTFMFVIVMLVVLSFLVFRINQLSHLEPSEDAVNEKLKTVQIPKFDQATLDKIKELQDQNIQVQSLFDQARNNPFNE